MLLKALLLFLSRHRETDAEIYIPVLLSRKPTEQRLWIIIPISVIRFRVILQIWITSAHGLSATIRDFNMISLAGLPVYWQEDRSDFVRDFIVSDEAEPVVRINFSDSLLSSHSVQYTDEVVAHFLKSAAGDILIADDSWEKVTSYCLPEGNRDYALPLAALCSRFSYFGTLLAHASVIEYNGEGVIFSGPSGIGKTTQAQLWEKYKQAQIINGDKVFIRHENDGFNAYGLPWKGSSEYCLNRKVPLKAVVILKQSEKNSVRKLGAESVECFMPHVFFPHWDKNCLEKALDIFDTLIKNVPVYLLECRADSEAAELMCKTIFG